jgi:phosphohistidine phosphatase SixA
MKTVYQEYPVVRTLFSDQKSRIVFTKRWVYSVLVWIAILCPVSGFSSDGKADLWAALKTGDSFVLLRHASAPGMGDPEYFDVEDCSTQRNLSDAGRKQATAIGDLFRAHGIEKARVYSSQWCRCLDTATLLSLGPVEVLPYLNSFFQQYERRESQTENLMKWIDKQRIEQVVVLVTHQVNITSLTGVYPSSGELVIVNRSKSGKLSVLGSIKTD